MKTQRIRFTGYDNRGLCLLCPECVVECRQIQSERSGENKVLSNAYSDRRERSGLAHVDSKLSCEDNVELFINWEIASCLCDFASPGAWASLPTSTARSISHACMDIKSYIPVCFCNLRLSSFVLRCYVISLPSSLFLRLF